MRLGAGGPAEPLRPGQPCPAQLGAQVVATLVTVVFTGIMTTIIGLAIHRTVGFRVSEEAEVAGIDLMQHAETGYEFGGLGTGGTFVPHPATSGHLKGEGKTVQPTKEEVNA